MHLNIVLGIFATMEAQSIKAELIEWLKELDDKSILTSLLQFKKSAESGDWVDKLTQEQIESLERGLSNLYDGKIISTKDFWISYGRQV